jgi:hypothetical protein
MAEENPFLASLDEAIEQLVRIAADPATVEMVDGLPAGGDERLEAVRGLDPDAFYSPLGERPAGARLSARWFESEAPGSEASGLRYVYVDGRPPGSPPPPTRPLPPAPSVTICASIGAVLCGSIGS